MTAANFRGKKELHVLHNTTSNSQSLCFKIEVAAVTDRRYRQPPQFFFSSQPPPSAR
jgi:hypothetical protein